MTRFFLVRHGETDWNKQEVFRGRKDIPLNENGISQAEKTSAKLQKESLDAIYTSPLDRSKKTADIIHKSHAVPLIIDQRLTDINFGKWQGLSHENIKKTFPDLYNKWQESPQTVTFPNGENLMQVYARATSLVEEILTQNIYNTVVLSSHRVLCKVFTCFFLGLALERFWFIRHDTCAISLFESIASGFITLKLNDTCHLAALQNNTSLSDF